MLERNIEQQKALATYAVDNSIPTLSPYQWGLVEKLSNSCIHLKKSLMKLVKQIYHFSGNPYNFDS
jgi:hypothetical protein